MRNTARKRKKEKSKTKNICKVNDHHFTLGSPSWEDFYRSISRVNGVLLSAVLETVGLYALSARTGAP
jgi:hypothetical protein